MIKSANMAVERVDLHNVDGDPRKVMVMLDLARRFPKAIEYWHESRITEPYQGRRGGVVAHQFVASIYAEEIGRWLQEEGLLEDKPIEEIELAALLHDADKVTEAALIRITMSEEPTWENARKAILNTTRHNDDLRKVDQLGEQYGKYFFSDIDQGERVHVARNVVAGAVHDDRLSRYGFSEKVVEIQNATEYTGCDEVDYLIDEYSDLSKESQTLVLQKVVMSLVDNSMRESEFVDPVVRTVAVFQKPDNALLSRAWTSWNKKGETAEEKQIRVSEKEIRFLSNLLNIEDKDFLSRLEARVEKKIV